MPADVIAPRSVYLQQTTIQTHVINFGDSNIANFRHLGTLPLNAFILKVAAYVEVAFNAGTTNTVTVGTTYNNANELLASGDLTPGTAGGYVEGTRGRGTQLTQVASPMEPQPNGLFVDTTEGGIGVYAKYAQSGTAATAGRLVIVIEYANRTNT